MVSLLRTDLTNFTAAIVLMTRVCCEGSGRVESACQVRFKMSWRVVNLAMEKPIAMNGMQRVYSATSSCE